MNWFRIGSYIWTASSAGWLVLGFLTQEPSCFFASATCIGAAWAWNYIGQDYE